MPIFSYICASFLLLTTSIPRQTVLVNIPAHPKGPAQFVQFAYLQVFLVSWYTKRKTASGRKGACI